MHLIQALERRRIALLGAPDQLRFRYLSSIGSSQSGHATRRDASFTAMRRSLQKLHSPFPRYN
jgi:hypothetical protein